jgi:hypothetical protein
MDFGSQTLIMLSYLSYLFLYFRLSTVIDPTYLASNPKDAQHTLTFWLVYVVHRGVRLPHGATVPEPRVPPKSNMIYHITLRGHPGLWGLETWG